MSRKEKERIEPIVDQPYIDSAKEEADMRDKIREARKAILDFMDKLRKKYED